MELSISQFLNLLSSYASTSKKIVDLFEKWQALEILSTRIGETPMALAFIRVLPIRVYTFFPSELLEKM